MENYHRRPKTAKPKFDDSSADNATPHHHNRPQHHGVMVISPNGKIRTYVSRALEVLTEADTPATQNADTDKQNQNIPTSTPGSSTGSSKATSKPTATPAAAAAATAAGNPSSILQPTSKSTQGVLTIKAQGRSITKAVTVAEILKRRMEGSLHQFTEIGQVTEHEIWDPNPDKPNLDPLTVSRHRPTIRIRLSKHLDTGATSGGLAGIDPSMPGASIPRDEHADEDSEDEDEVENGSLEESWPGAILDRDAAARRFVGYQAPTGNDIYL
ncbi:hypothetical protein BGZ70_008363 [Mortierella alpina]|uniref:DNA/RNA-binding protein Alba-like domain-containing protein n=1 Tax=Mortierella alpina TaxID=64518 RepID=A0A9P6J408_MORAP|nr:hypothetical protein BGZ70_008363 [Mortierella alpina]